MPTITSATAMTLVTGAPGKGPASLLGTGEPGFDFQTLLGATAVTVPPVADAAVRQPLAGDGTALPVETVATTPIAAAPTEILPAVAITKAAPQLMPTPLVEEPAAPAPDKLAPAVAPAPTPMLRQQPIVLIKAAPKKEDGEPARDPDEPETPADPSVPTQTLPPIMLAQPAAPTVMITRGVKTSPLPSISVVHPSADRPVIAAAIPQTPRDIRWDGAAPIVTQLAAPVAPALPVEVPLTPMAQSTAPVATAASTPVPEAAPVTAMPSMGPQPAAPVPVPLPPAFAPAPAPALAPIAVGPALQVFGAAISAATRHERTEDAAADPLGSLGTISPAAVRAAPIATADQPILDMRQERWPQAMIAHIESLRDNANATDTRIRLVPDALGTIDVAVTRDRDTVHVQFTAEQATTRSLIQDAQPRLAALAEERGLRLGQTVVDASAAGATSQQPQQSQQQQRQPQRDAGLPAAQRRTADRHDDQDRADDGRLA